MTALLTASFGLLLHSTIFLALALLALHVTRHRGPAVQSLISRAALAGILLLLVMTPLAGQLPAIWRVTEPGPQQVAFPSAPTFVVPSSAAPFPPAPLVSGKTSNSPGFSRENAASKAADTANIEDTIRPQGAAEAGPTKVGAASSAPTLHTGFPNSSRSRSALADLEGVSGGERVSWGGFLWAIGTTFLLLWLGICHQHLLRLRRTACPVISGPAFEVLTNLVPSPPPLLSHSAVLSPFLAGIRRLAIFLPAAYETEFDPTALRAILTHELAHLARRDIAWTLASRLLCAVLWPQPLLWLLCRRLEQIGEEACDQSVLARDCSPRAYADCLLTLAERRPPGRRERALGAGVAPFRSSLGRRISRILDKGTHAMSTISLRLRLGIAAGTVAVALGGVLLVSSVPAQTMPIPAKKPQTASAAAAAQSQAAQAAMQAQLAQRQAELALRQRRLAADAAIHLDPALNHARFLAGLTAVQGPGVTVTLRDSKKPLPHDAMPPGTAPPSIIHDTDINQVINELKAAGAEAIAVNDQRLVTTSSMRATGPTIMVNYMQLTSPFVIKAIGNPRTLMTALNVPGGIAAQIKFFDSVMFSVKEAARLTLPAFSGGSEPRYATPIGTTKPLSPFSSRRRSLIRQRAQIISQLSQLQAQNAALSSRLQAMRTQMHAAAKKLTPPQLSKTSAAIRTDYERQALAKQIAATQVDLIEKEMIYNPGASAIFDAQKKVALLKTAYRQLPMQGDQTDYERQALAAQIADAQADLSDKERVYIPNSQALVDARRKVQLLEKAYRQLPVLDNASQQSPIQEKLRFIAQIHQYNRKWIAQANEEVAREHATWQQQKALQQQRQLQAEMAAVNAQIAHLDGSGTGH